MGYERRAIEVSFRVSRHNDERDQQDDAAAEQLYRDIATLLATPEYERLDASVVLR